MTFWILTCTIIATINAGGSPIGSLAVFSSNYLKKTADQNINNQNQYENSYNKNKFNPYNPYAGYKQYVVPRSPDADSDSESDHASIYTSNCPDKCTCKGLSIDCSNRNLIKVPENIPSNIIQVDLQGNKLTFVKNEDFSYLRSLKVLHLQNNRIEALESDVFKNLNSLERVRLNNNQITYLPDGIFKNLNSLKRLDLSFNKLKSISKQLLAPLVNINNLQIDNNQIKCIQKGSFDNLKQLSIL